MKVVTNKGELRGLGSPGAALNRFEAFYLKDQTAGNYVTVTMISMGGIFGLQFGPALVNPGINYFDTIFVKDQTTGLYVSVVLVSDGSTPPNYALQYGTVPP